MCEAIIMNPARLKAILGASLKEPLLIGLGYTFIGKYWSTS